MSIFVKFLLVFGMSMVPVIELRAAVPWGVANGLPYIPVLIVSILGNMIPVPFIIIFIKRIFAWMREKSERLKNLVSKLEARALAKGDVLEKYELLGLFILVAIPLPGTGAWTGSLVAAIFNLKLKPSFLAIFAGVTAAGLIMTLISYGVDILLG